ncbi:MAG: hypothetical protein ABJA81_10395 [Nocardioidaceae bacterium]
MAHPSPPEVEAQHAWRAVLVWHFVTSVLGAIAAVIWAIAGTLTGGSGGPEVAWDLAPRAVPGAWPALLVLKRTQGAARSRQRDVERQRLVMWRGPGVTIPGHVWLSGDSLLWAPTARWRDLGAREVSIQIVGTQVTRLRTGSYGLVVRPDAVSEVWLWIQGSRASEAVESVAARAA